MSTVIIGAGASGLATAIKIKQNNPLEDVTILEKMDTIGKKILATGNGRCNLTNRNASYSSSFASSVLESNSVDDTLNFFSSIGLCTVEEDEGRIYPMSLQATTVLELLKSACKNLGVKIVTDIKINKIENRFLVITNKRTFKCENLVIATGGKASKNLGSDGDGYEILKSFGHTITPIYPALVQLNSSSKYCRALKGLRRKCNFSIEVDGKQVASEYGEVLFADYGVSGIVVMNLSHYVSKNKGKKICAVLDLVPNMSESDIYAHLKAYGSLVGILGIKFAEIIEKQAESDFSKMAKYCKNWRLIITGTKGFDYAQVTLGGVNTNEFTKDCESKIIKGLFATGEVLDVSEKCGGYNLQWAWSSALAAANKIGENK